MLKESYGHLLFTQPLVFLPLVVMIKLFDYGTGMVMLYCNDVPLLMLSALWHFLQMVPTWLRACKMDLSQFTILG